MQDVIETAVAPKIEVTPLSPACGAEISGVDLSKPLSDARGRRDQGRLGQASGAGVPRPKGVAGRSAALCLLFRRSRQPQEGARGVAHPHRGRPAGQREGAAGQQHQGGRQADRRLRRGRILVPHRFRLYAAAVQIHVPLCARTAVARRQYDVLEHVQGLRGSAAGAEGEAQGQDGAAHPRIQSRKAGQFVGRHQRHPASLASDLHHASRYRAQRRCSSTG